MNIRHFDRRTWMTGLMGTLCAADFARGQGSPSEDSSKLRSVNDQLRAGVDFLKSRQGTDGGWSTQREPGITALVATALLRSRLVSPGEPVIDSAFKYLDKFVDEAAGGFPSAAHANYTTCIALLAYREANKDGRFDERIRKAQGFLKSRQWDESENRPRMDAYFGGAGYGGSNDRPDMSNTAFFMEALRETGLPADDPALQKALVFVSRCQNLKSEFNDQPWAGLVNDGGFVYTAAKGGSSMAGGDPKTGLRSYAGMTYAGLKSMIYAGLTKDDPRVEAALKYIRENYTLDENPGLGQQGLFYYYQTFAKTLHALKVDSLVDSKGTAHDWRKDLTEALAKRQAKNGSWVNPADRFMEGDPNLVTAYSLIALSYAKV